MECYEESQDTLGAMFVTCPNAKCNDTDLSGHTENAEGVT